MEKRALSMLTVAVAVLAGLCSTALAGNPASKGAAIVSDPALFSEQFISEVSRVVQVTSDPTFAKASSGETGLAVPAGEQPAIAAIEKKYGKADKVESSTIHLASSAGESDQGVDLYHYDRYALAVAKDGPNKGKVVWLGLRIR